MKFLVTGASGQLGSDLVTLLRTRNHDVAAPPRTELDLAHSPQELADCVADAAPDCIVNCAAMTAVDECEANPLVAMQVNCDGPLALARAAADRGCRFTQISTDYVFSGDQGRPYTEADAPSPINVYGQTKLAAEREIEAAVPGALIVRSAWMYGVQGDNFVYRMLDAARHRDMLRVVDDQVGTPTWTAHLAQAVTCLVEGGHGGTYHFTNSGVCSWYDFAVAIVAEGHAAGMLDHATPVRPVTSEEYPRPAARPHSSLMSKAKIRGTLDEPIAHWREALRAMLAEVQI